MPFCSLDSKPSIPYPVTNLVTDLSYLYLQPNSAKIEHKSRIPYETNPPHRAHTRRQLLLTAQQTPTPTNSPQLQAELQRLGSAAETQILALPSFTCEETATSQLIRNQKLRTNIQVQGTVRVVHKPDGAFDETYTYKRPFHLLFIPTRLPYSVRGGFDSALSYFLPPAQACYQYTLSPGRIDFATRTGAVPGHICEERGLKGFALLNPAGDITHIQRTTPRRRCQTPQTHLLCRHRPRTRNPERPRLPALPTHDRNPAPGRR